MTKQYNRSREVILLYLILVFSIVLLILVAWLVNEKFTETAYNFRKVNEGHQIINKIDETENILLNTGFSVRSYLSVERTYPLEKLTESHKLITAQIADIHSLLPVASSEVPTLDSLEKQIDIPFEGWSILIKTSHDSMQEVNNEITLKNREAMQNITGLMARIQSRENEVVETYVADAASGIRATSIMALATTLICVSIIIFALIRLNGEIKNGVLMQAELKSKVNELNRSNSDLERFAYVASHDLHEPLRKLHAFSEILTEREKDNISPEGQQIIGRMHAFVTRMQKLIDDLLEFSLNFSNIDKKEVNLDQALRNTIANLSETITSSGAIIDAETLPGKIVGFESQVNQVFQNIISNSIKYARENVPPHISIRSSIVTGSEITGIHADDVKRKFFKITFSDNGIGFDNKYKEKIFVIFQRLHGKSEYEGTGIGLATCMRVMINHGGYISASGRENEGAEFDVYFPVV